MKEPNQIKSDVEDISLLESNYKFEILELSPQPKNLNPINDLPVILSTDKISNSVMLFYSIPAFSKMACLVMLSIHSIIYYENLGANILYLSFFVALARAFEILLKPLIAHFSDNLNRKLGRRRPFMLIGMPLYAIFFVCLFNPPKNLNSFNISIFFGVFYTLFFIADTICNVPYNALAPELSSDTREREKLYIFYYVFQYLGVLFASGGPVLYNRFLKRCDCSHCYSSIIANVIECGNKCKVECDFKSNQDSLLYMSILIGIIYVFAIALLSFTIEEKRHTKSKEDSYIVPKFFRVINNVPFMKLIVPWILDVTISTIFATMFPFFLSVIINPQAYCLNHKIDLNSEICFTNTWLGLGISIFFIFCILSMALWHYIVISIGKKKSWALYSLISIVTFSLFMFCSEGSFYLLILFCILNAFPAGGAYINDVFVSDIIDYDQFKCGSRNEGLFTVFSTFIPKIVSIFAQSIPLIIMGIIGFVSSKNGENHIQPTAISEFIRFYFIGIPVVLAMVSFYFKMKYPIDDDLKMQLLRASIQIQNDKQENMKERLDYYKIKDPILSEYSFQIFCKMEKHIQTKIVCDHFDTLEYIDLLYKGNYKDIKNTVMNITLIWMFSSILFLFLLIHTFGYLKFKSWCIFPMISLLIFSLSLVLLGVNYSRVRIIDKVISGELEIDLNFLRLIIFSRKSDKSL